METEVHEDLLEIMQNSALRLGARICGFEYLLGLSAKEEGLNQILTFKKYVPFLVSCIQNCDENQSILTLAHKCLINISTSQEGAAALFNSKNDLILYLLKKICDKDFEFVDYSCYILSNLVTFNIVLKQDDFTSDPALLDRLFKCFLSTDSETRDKYKFLALYFATLSGYHEKRELVVKNEKFVTNFINHINLEEPTVRRMGVAVTLRNICCDTDIHKFLIERDTLAVILLPLMGSEEYVEEVMEKLPLDCQYLERSKTREPVPQIRRALVQALSMLCYTEDGWNYVVNHSVYFVMRELHRWETDPTTKEAIETLVGFLLVEKYNDMDVSGRNEILPSITEIVKDLPDFIVV